MPSSESHYTENELHRPVDSIGMTQRTESTVDGGLNTSGQVMATIDGLPSEVSGGMAHCGMLGAASCSRPRSEPVDFTLPQGSISADVRHLPMPETNLQDLQEKRDFEKIGEELTWPKK